MIRALASPTRHRFAVACLALLALLATVLGGCAKGSIAPAGHHSVVALPDETDPDITPEDIEATVRALTDERMEGRRAGTAGEGVASDYLVRAMQAIGLEPAGDDGGSRNAFEFTAGVALGPHNELTLESTDGSTTRLALEQDWRPLAFSRSGEIPLSPVVFAGYGLVAAGEDHGDAIDEYEDLDVKDRWVLVFRDLPMNLAASRRQHLRRYSSRRHKAMIARDRGARGVLFVSGPRGQFRDELVRLRFDASLAGTRIGVISISDELAERLIAQTDMDLDALQAATDERILDGLAQEQTSIPAEIHGARLAAHVDLETLRSEGHNVIGRLQVGAEPSQQTIVLGAHFDHLGRGEMLGSLASGDDVGRIHPGADDNASGVAVLLEIAQFLAHEKDRGASLGQRDFVFAAWSGEELGLLGSDKWVEDQQNPHSHLEGPVAYLNFDMVGRLGSDLVIQGLGSSQAWAGILERTAAPHHLSILPQQDSYLPTDATSFYTRAIPILSAFTGVHSEYHTPNDTPDRLNYEGAAEIATLFGRIAIELSQASDPPPYEATQAGSSGPGRLGFRVFLGTVPDYAQTDLVGVRLTGVAPGGPAEKGGVRGSDVIVEVDGRTVENLYDYTYALDALRVGAPAQIVVLREGERVECVVVPTSRD